MTSHALSPHSGTPHVPCPEAARAPRPGAPRVHVAAPVCGATAVVDLAKILHNSKHNFRTLCTCAHAHTQHSHFPETYTRYASLTERLHRYMINIKCAGATGADASHSRWRMAHEWVHCCSVTKDPLRESVSRCCGHALGSHVHAAGTRVLVLRVRRRCAHESAQDKLRRANKCEWLPLLQTL